MKKRKLSIKAQLGILSISFLIFASIVIFQLQYNQSQQSSEIEDLKESHKIVIHYLTIAENERKILKSLEEFINSPVAAIQDKEIMNIRIQINDWETYLNKWIENIKGLNSKNFLEIKDELFKKRFIEKKQRNARAYKKAIELCKNRDLESAKAVIFVEKIYNPPIAKTIRAIINSIQTKIEKDKNTRNTLYTLSIVILLIALIILIYFSFRTFSNIIISLNKLKAGAERIIDENYTKTVKVSTPLELSELANSFNEMQVTIKERDKKILTDQEHINSLNEELSLQVDDGKQTIAKQNISLTKKNEELEQILYAASHDLRTPLISIQGFSEELKTSCEELKENLAKENIDIETIKEIIDEEINSALKYIVNGSTRMELLLEGLLRLSRMGKNALDIQELDMNELTNNIKDSLTVQLTESKAELTIETLEDCKGDRYMIEQIIQNFINNAIKYRSNERDCKILVYSEKISENIIRYYVEDNGIGLNEEQKEKVFNAFYRVREDKVPGDGVGLSIARRAVDLHSGTIGVESEDGQGSIFYFEIPA